MNLSCVAEHTVDLSLLSGGICVDAGCRGFLFSKAMKEMGCSVYGFDLEDMDAPEGIRFVKAAILSKSGIFKYVNTADQQAKHIHEKGTEEVEGISLNLLMSLLGGNIDVLKLDVEGAEIDILLSMVNPIPKMISCEFHLHTGTAMADIRKVFTHLNDIGYKKVFEDYSEKHGLMKNYWDVLWVKNDLC